METRNWSSVFRPWPLWLYVAWWMLEITSTTQEAVAISGRINAYLVANPFVAILIFIVSVGLVIIWPNLMRRWGRYIPKSQQERLRSLEDRLGPVEQSSGQIQGITATQHQLIGLLGSLQGIVDAFSEVEKEARKKLCDRLSDIEELLPKAQFATIHKDIGEIQQSAQSIPPLVLRLLDISELIWQCDDLITEFQIIQNVYGAASPLNQPFSGWRVIPQWTDSEPGVALRDSEKWARDLESHIHSCRYLSTQWDRELVHERLSVPVLSWRRHQQNLTGDGFLEILQVHRKQLLAVRERFAVEHGSTP